MDEKNTMPSGLVPGKDTNVGCVERAGMIIVRDLFHLDCEAVSIHLFYPLWSP